MGWVSPTGASGWTDPANIYDDNLTTYAFSSPITWTTLCGYTNDWSTNYIEATHAVLNCNKIRVYINLRCTHVLADVYNGVWHNVHCGVVAAGWNEFSFTAKSVTKARLKATAGAPLTPRIYELDFWEIAWEGKISGVTNPAKVMGVDVTAIAKVKGVTST